ncbi:hypothetical protein K1719_042305 [Acacia pycnantha]|nr:hypothetical protein K1719_042305 [Acacia pycnantha]
MAKRRRRQQITEKFTALSATIPSLKKRVRELEKGPSLTPIKRIEFDENDHNFYEVNEVLPNIEVRVSENKQVFMGIYCEKHKGIEFKILSLLEDFDLVSPVIASCHLENLLLAYALPLLLS